MKKRSLIIGTALLGTLLVATGTRPAFAGQPHRGHVSIGVGIRHGNLSLSYGIPIYYPYYGHPRRHYRDDYYRHRRSHRHGWRHGRRRCDW